MTIPVYKDETKSVEERVQDLLSRMTIEEKIAQLTSVWLNLDARSGEVSPNQGLISADFDPAQAMRHGIGQIARPFGSQPLDPVKGVEMVNELQQRLVEGTRLGIPAICHVRTCAACSGCCGSLVSRPGRSRGHRGRLIWRPQPRR
ncbi:MAG: hypothetical protein JRI95_08805 [Deltaproteobacteria bacterium]|nr:hypothetical protein [Deltaproteobacteria bacterium]